MVPGIPETTILNLLKLLTRSEIARLTEFNVGKHGGLAKRKLKMALLSDAEPFSPVHTTVITVSQIEQVEATNVLPFKGKVDQNQGTSLLEDEASHKEEMRAVANYSTVVPSRETKVIAVTSEAEVHAADVLEIANADLVLTKNEQMLEKAGILSAQKVEYLKKLESDRAEKSQVSATTFLLREREKLSQTLGTMKKVEVLKSYQEAGLVDIELEKFTNAHNLGDAAGSGVLVNKKQY